MTSILAILAPASLWGLGLIIGPRSDTVHPATRIGMAYGIGTVSVVLIIGGAALAGLSLTNTTILLGAAALVLARVSLRKPPRRLSPGTLGAIGAELWRGMVLWLVSLRVIGAMSLGVITTLGLLTLCRAWIRPIAGEDAFAIYSLKAKIIYLTETIPPGLFETVGAPNYPLGLPLQQVWASLVTGSWSETAIKLTIWGYFVSVLLVAYGMLREKFSPTLALVGASFVWTLPIMLQHAQEPYTNLPLAYFVLGQAVALTQYVNDRHGQNLFAASAFAAGAVLMRADGPVFVIANAMLLTVLRVSGRARLIYVGPAAVVWGVWLVTKAQLGIETTLALDVLEMSSVIERFWVVASALFQALFFSGNWPPVWVLFFAIFAVRFKSTFDREQIFLSWPVVINLFTVVGLFVMTPLAGFLKEGTVLHRLILHVAPLAALWVAFYLCGQLSKGWLFRGKGWNVSRVVPMWRTRE